MADTEQTTENTPTPEQDVQDTTDAWGDNFDAERAKKLVENLRADKAALKERLAAAEKRADEFEKRSADLEKRLATSERDAAMAGILRDHPELEDWQDYLSGDTLDEVRESAEKLAKKLAGVKAPETASNEAKAESPTDAEKTPQDGDSEAPKGNSVARRPTPKLVPGHGGDSPTTYDYAAIAAKSRRS